MKADQSEAWNRALEKAAAKLEVETSAAILAIWKRGGNVQAELGIALAAKVLTLKETP